ncbi:cell division protein FtsZ [Rhodohalobacter barkolensis]|uniref:Cell division protein FtsZ n=1 Tax=Rhodohalobacter barkolensis TaxID=2053187 RepID=A0A2N0VLE3_9BACT|nr:cell division protein FtsZ [Rhodohalobacter barkolensis]PKD44961.1 cell division protein FtsZ [Rhodohalobacter barkolensis]
MEYNNTRFSFDEKGQDNAKIKVIGVGGGGGNAINNMIRKGLDSVEYIALNTDAQALKNNSADVAIQVGSNLTSGLGAGARPEIGREAVEENRHEIDEAVDSADMIFITAGMGGGTGTGGAPVVAGIAKRKGILTVGVVTTPFLVEGKVRMKYALEGITELKKNCDTVIVIPNERLLDISDENTSLMEAFEQANHVLYNATRGISDLILMPGLINLDFADVRTTMIDGGAAIMGSATASGPDRAEIAAREAINSPLLDGVSIRGARNVLVNISAGANLGMRETTTATSIIQQEAGEDAEIILGTVLDDAFEDELRVTVIATGFELSEDKTKARVAPNKKSEPILKTKSTNLPKASDIAQRHNSTLDGTYYKGEKNLKNLDTPAIHRREVKHMRSQEEVQADDDMQHRESIERKKASNDNNSVSNRDERIDKRDTEQPAFLRKIMD